MKQLITRFGEFRERTDLFEEVKNGRVRWKVDRWGSGKKAPLEDARGIYVLYRGRVPIYIGKAIKGKDSIARRLHRHAHDWYAHAWDNVSWFHFDKSVQKGVIEAVEALLIANIPGTLNGSLPGGHLGKRCYPGSDKSYAQNRLWQK